MKATTTELGRALRKLRIDRAETLGDMAEKLGITSSYLSAIEKGKRPAPDGLTDKIADLYQLGAELRQELSSAADKTLQSVKLALDGSSDPKREAALCFARSFDDLDDETAESVLKLLRKNREAK
jgi:HTH-type transcriptional regulator, competence development regulator